MRRWAHADQLRRNARKSSPDPVSDIALFADGPPDGLRTYPELLRGLRELMRERGISQRELCRRNRRLRRSTIGAVLRGERSASHRMMDAIVGACGVSDEARQAWSDAWWHVGLPHQAAAHRRRREGYQYVLSKEAGLR